MRKLLQLLICLLLLLIPSMVHAAIAFDAASGAETGGGGGFTTINDTHVVTAGSDLILIAFCSGEAGGLPANTLSSSATYNGDAMTEVTQSQLTDQGITAYYLLNPDTGSNTLTCNFPGANGDVKVSAVSFTGVDQDAPEASNQASGTGTTITVDVTTVADNAVVIDGAVNGASTSVLTAGSGQTERNNLTGNAYTQGTSTEPKATGGSVTMDWSSTVSFQWVTVALSLAPAAGGSPTRRIIPIQ